MGGERIRETKTETEQQREVLRLYRERDGEREELRERMGEGKRIGRG